MDTGAALADEFAGVCICVCCTGAQSELVGWQGSAGAHHQSGDAYLRTLLIQGAKSVVMSAAKRSDRTSQWVLQLKERVGWHKAVVALANKSARILWCVMTSDAAYDPSHVPPLQGAT